MSKKNFRLELPSVVAISGARRLKEKQLISIKRNKLRTQKFINFKKILWLELPSVVVISGAIYFKIKEGNIKKRRNLKHQDL